MAAVTLPVLVSLLMARYADGPAVAVPDGRAGILGMSDLQIFDQIWAEDGNPMGGMRFAQGVSSDPRRINALIQQRILVVFYSILPASREQNPRELSRDSYLMRMQHIREECGGISAMGLAADAKLSWEGDGETKGYRDLFTAALWPMAGRPEVKAIQDAIIANQQDIFRSFREAAALSMRAAMCAEQEQDQEAWGIYHSVIQAMWQTIADRLSDLGAKTVVEDWSLPEDELEQRLSYVQFGGVAQHMPFGHRAPQAGLPQWRRSGGRHY